MMKITLDFENKMVTLYQPTNIKDLVEKLKEINIKYTEWSINIEAPYHFQYDVVDDDATTLSNTCTNLNNHVSTT